MFRFIYTISDLLAAVFAILSPVAIFHWLIRAVNVAEAAPVINALNPLFDPLNGMLELFFHAPTLVYNGQAVPTTQGVLACLLTVGFFICNFVSESLRAAEQRVNVTKEAFIQKRRLQQLKKEHQQEQRQLTSNRRICVTISYDFQACPTGGAYFEGNYTRYGGKMQGSSQNGLSLEFSNLEHAIKYCLEAGQSILSHYATLRPLDPQPAYQIGLHAEDAALPVSQGIAYARLLSAFAGNNQLVFSPVIRAMMEQENLSTQYHFQSLGLYVIEGRQQEIFRLFYKKTGSSSF